MINIIEINAKEFKKSIFKKYESLFPEEERRYWPSIIKTYKKGIEHFYKIVLDNNEIGFFMLEKLDNKPYYLDYFAIYKEYQNKGYGTKALKYLIDNIIKDDGLIGEIEQIDEVNPITIKRYSFYKQFGFIKTDSLYNLWEVYYTPLILLKDNKYTKEELDKIFFEYYLTNMGMRNLKKNCYIIK